MKVLSGPYLIGPLADTEHLTNLIDEALGEELSNLAYYNRRGFAIMAICGTSRWNVLLSYQCHKEKRQLEESVRDMVLQRDMYLQEVQNTLVSLIGVGGALRVFNLPDSLVDQVKLWAREVAKKYKLVAFVWVILSTTKASLCYLGGC